MSQQTVDCLLMWLFIRRSSLNKCNGPSKIELSCLMTRWHGKWVSIIYLTDISFINGGFVIMTYWSLFVRNCNTPSTFSKLCVTSKRTVKTVSPNFCVLLLKTASSSPALIFYCYSWNYLVGYSAIIYVVIRIVLRYFLYSPKHILVSSCMNLLWL